jgi:hypothetical protein
MFALCRPLPPAPPPSLAMVTPVAAAVAELLQEVLLAREEGLR